MCIRDSPYAKILTNPEEFGQSDLQTPENVYQNLVKIYQKGHFDELAEKSESFRVVLSGTTFQPKFDLMMANYDGRLNGKIKWERSLKKVSLKYPGSPEAIKAKEVAEQELANKDTSIDYAKASAQLAEAVARLKTIQKLRKKQ